ncbi:23S rRNA (pseudouridine(1915)-N(3))-methyltransferase RlmH [Microbaculum marinum]|uniref:Ribosomal RNA large subunit methyltransferase H n=1 Tax=Microbaculum marinum TaxID=1764581 RepID=A0AAW9R9T6_9HYPH
MRIEILSIGRLKAASPERDLVDRYLDRARAGGRAIGLSAFEVVEFGDGKSPEAEAETLLARVPAGAKRIVLDERGRNISSETFAQTLASWRDEGVPATSVLIGGPDGHGRAARTKADLILSFGAMTWPHQLVRAMAAEQLYRAVTILTGHPYHRA